MKEWGGKIVGMFVLEELGKKSTTLHSALESVHRIKELKSGFYRKKESENYGKINDFSGI